MGKKECGDCFAYLECSVCFVGMRSEPFVSPHKSKLWSVVWLLLRLTQLKNTPLHTLYMEKKTYCTACINKGFKNQKYLLP